MDFHTEIKKLLERLIAIKDEIKIPNSNNLFGRQPTRQRKERPASRQNHMRGESKARRKMAAKSRRINRRK